MTRIPQEPAVAGSQRWLQLLVETDPGSLGPDLGGDLEWLSPRAADDFAEYRDAGFLERLGLEHLTKALAEFWPRGGPVWDGLARSGNGVYLVEAKSHVQEFLSTPCAATSPASRAKIHEALERTRTALDADARSDWMRCFFQYANRLAHMWWLRENGIDAHLLFVSFVGDSRQKGPRTSEVWDAVFLAADHALGLSSRHALAPMIHHVHPDVSGLQ
jgi:hypothetical protein